MKKRMYRRPLSAFLSLILLAAPFHDVIAKADDARESNVHTIVYTTEQIWLLLDAAQQSAEQAGILPVSADNSVIDTWLQEQLKGKMLLDTVTEQSCCTAYLAMDPATNQLSVVMLNPSPVPHSFVLKITGQEQLHSLVETYALGNSSLPEAPEVREPEMREPEDSQSEEVQLEDSQPAESAEAGEESPLDAPDQIVQRRVAPAAKGMLAIRPLVVLERRTEFLLSLGKSAPSGKSGPPEPPETPADEQVIQLSSQEINNAEEGVVVEVPSTGAAVVTFSIAPRAAQLLNIPGGTLTINDNGTAIHAPSTGAAYPVTLSPETAIIVSNSSALTINLNNPTNPVTINRIQGGQASLTFQGAGTLHVETTDPAAISAPNISFSGSGIVTAKGGNFGIQSTNSFIRLGNGITVEAVGGQYGIYANAAVEVNTESILHAEGKSENGIHSLTNILVAGSGYADGTGGKNGIFAGTGITSSGNSSMYGTGGEIGILATSFLTSNGDSTTPGGTPTNIVHGKGSKWGIKSTTAHITASKGGSIVGEADGPGGTGVEVASTIPSNSIHLEASNGSIKGTGVKYGVVSRAYFSPAITATNQGNITGIATGAGGNGIFCPGDSVQAESGSIVIGEAPEKDGIGIESYGKRLIANGGSILGNGEKYGLHILNLNGINSMRVQGNSGYRGNLAGTATGPQGVGVALIGPGYIEANLGGSVSGTSTGPDGIGIMRDRTSSQVPHDYNRVETYYDGTVTGTGDKHGIYVIGTVTAANTSSITAAASQLQPQGNAALWTTGTIAASQTAKVHEIYMSANVQYTATPLSLVNTPPYKTAVGRNMKAMSNYTWTDSRDSFTTSTVPGYVVYKTAGAGLVAERSAPDISVRAVRKTNVAGEPVSLANSATHMITLLGGTAKDGKSRDLNVTLWDAYLIETASSNNPQKYYQIFDPGVTFTLNSTRPGFVPVPLSTDSTGTLNLTSLYPGAYTLSGGTVSGYKSYEGFTFLVTADLKVVKLSGKGVYQETNPQGIQLYYSPEMIKYTVRIVDRYENEQHQNLKKVGGMADFTAILWPGPHTNAENGVGGVTEFKFPIQTLPGMDTSILLHPRYQNWALLQHNGFHSPRYYTIFDNSSTLFNIKNSAGGYALEDIRATAHVSVDTNAKIFTLTNDYALTPVNIQLQSSYDPAGTPLSGTYKFYPLDRESEAQLVTIDAQGTGAFKVRPEISYRLVQTQAPDGYSIIPEIYMFSLQYKNITGGYNFQINGDSNTGKIGWHLAYTENSDSLAIEQKHYIQLISFVSTLTVTVEATEVWHHHGEPVFILALTPKAQSPGASPAKTCYKQVMVGPGETDLKRFLGSHADNTRSGTVVFADIAPGEYTLTAKPTLRYGGQNQSQTVMLNAPNVQADTIQFANTSLRKYSHTGSTGYSFTLKQ